MWLKLPSLKHGFKLGESSNCNLTIDQSVYFFDHIYSDFSLS